MFLLKSCLFLSVALFSLRLNVLDSPLLLLFRQIMFGIGKWRNSLYLSALDVNNSTKSYNLDCCANGVSFYSFIATLRNTDGLDEVHSYSERWQICLCLYIIYIIYIIYRSWKLGSRSVGTLREPFYWPNCWMGWWAWLFWLCFKILFSKYLHICHRSE